MTSRQHDTANRHAWLSWLNWDNADDCQWALDYLILSGMANAPPQNLAPREQLGHIIAGWPGWESCFGTESYSQLDSQMRGEYENPDG